MHCIENGFRAPTRIYIVEIFILERKEELMDTQLKKKPVLNLINLK